VEAAFELKDCQKFYFLLNSKSLKNADGEIIGCLVTLTDITERKLTDTALIQNQAKLEAAFASMTNAVFISDEQGRFVNFNDAFVTYHRFKNKEECYKIFAECSNILDVFMADGTPAPVDIWAVSRALRGETATDVEYTLRRKDTGEKWVGSYNFAPILNKDGAIFGSIVIACDITDRKKVEKALQESEGRYMAFFNTTAVGTLEINLTGRLINVNDRSCQITGYSCEEMLGMNVTELSHPNDRDYDRKLLVNYLSGETPTFDVEKCYVRKDGGLMWVHITAALVYDTAGRPLRSIGVLQGRHRA
jgi:PAS domain S-box-containing protein